MYKALVVDADRDARTSLRQFPWVRYGFDLPVEAVSGKEAWHFLLEGSFDLVVMDVRLPDVNGIEFLQQISSIDTPPCVLLMSSCGDFEQAQIGIGLGVFDYIVKPFTEQSFAVVLQRAEIFLRKMSGVHKDLSLRENSGTNQKVIYKRSNELGDLLVAGRRDMLKELKSWIEYCESWPETQTRTALQDTEAYLASRFDREFPWVKNLKDRDGDDASAGELLDVAEEMLTDIEKYELLDKNSLFRSICIVVQEGVEHGISLGMVADRLGISADYAGRIFKKKTGMHFATFVMHTKMERGKELLAAGRLKNYEISARLGYSNPDYFRQLFKNYTGMTPTEYRNMYRFRSFR